MLRIRRLGPPPARATAVAPATRTRLHLPPGPSPLASARIARSPAWPRPCLAQPPLGALPRTAGSAHPRQFRRSHLSVLSRASAPAVPATVGAVRSPTLVSLPHFPAYSSLDVMVASVPMRATLVPGPRRSPWASTARHGVECRLLHPQSMHDETTTRSSGFTMSSRPPDSMDWSFPSSARDAAQVLLARQGQSPLSRFPLLHSPSLPSPP